MNKYIGIFGVGIIITIIVIVGINNQAGASSVTKNVAYANNQPVQEVTLSFKNYEYLFSDATFTAGIPVRIIVDLNTVTGCMRDIRIPAFGISKYVSPGDNVIEFTPQKTGSFTIACSMNMGRGTFVVN